MSGRAPTPPCASGGDEALLQGMARFVSSTVAADGLTGHSWTTPSQPTAAWAIASASAANGHGCKLLEEERPPLPVSTLDLGMGDCVRRAAMRAVGEGAVLTDVTVEMQTSAAPLAHSMPTAMLLVRSSERERGVAPASGAADERESHGPAVADAIVEAGAEAFVRAAVGMVLGACASEQGPACILGDSRRNVRLADESWSQALDGLDDSGGSDAEPAGTRPTSAGAWESDDRDAYPDL